MRPDLARENYFIVALFGADITPVRTPTKQNRGSSGVGSVVEPREKMAGNRYRCRQCRVETADRGSVPKTLRYRGRSVTAGSAAWPHADDFQAGCVISICTSASFVSII